MSKYCRDCGWPYPESDSDDYMRHLVNGDCKRYQQMNQPIIYEETQELTPELRAGVAALWPQERAEGSNAASQPNLDTPEEGRDG